MLSSVQFRMQSSCTGTISSRRTFRNSSMRSGIFILGFPLLLHNSDTNLYCAQGNQIKIPFMTCLIYLFVFWNQSLCFVFVYFIMNFWVMSTKYRYHRYIIFPFWSATVLSELHLLSAIASVTFHVRIFPASIHVLDGFATVVAFYLNVDKWAFSCSGFLFPAGNDLQIPLSSLHLLLASHLSEWGLPIIVHTSSQVLWLPPSEWYTHLVNQSACAKPLIMPHDLSSSIQLGIHLYESTRKVHDAFLAFQLFALMHFG